MNNLVDCSPSLSISLAICTFISPFILYSYINFLSTFLGTVMLFIVFICFSLLLNAFFSPASMMNKRESLICRSNRSPFRSTNRFACFRRTHRVQLLLFFFASFTNRYVCVFISDYNFRLLIVCMCWSDIFIPTRPNSISVWSRHLAYGLVNWIWLQQREEHSSRVVTAARRRLALKSSNEKGSFSYIR